MVGSLTLWAAVLVAAGLVGACGQVAPNSERNAMRRTASQNPRDHAALLERMGLALPPSAKIEYAEYQAGQDDNAHVILLMSRGDWEALRAKPPLDAMPYDRYSADEAMRLGRDHGAWRPATEPEIKGAQLQLPNAEALNIGVAPAGGGRVRIYLFWFQT